jgi:predicted GNAT family acetyltransferase
MNHHQNDAMLDETLEETFPASDPSGQTVETGIAIDVTDVLIEQVRDNPAAHRFELAIDGQVAFLSYERKADSLVFVHTEVPQALRGRRLGESLVKAGLRAARREGLHVVPVCPFVKAYLVKHPQAARAKRDDR